MSLVEWLNFQTIFRHYDKINDSSLSSSKSSLSDSSAQLDSESKWGSESERESESNSEDEPFRLENTSYKRLFDNQIKNKVHKSNTLIIKLINSLFNSRSILNCNCGYSICYFIRINKFLIIICNVCTCLIFRCFKKF